MIPSNHEPSKKIIYYSYLHFSINDYYIESNYKGDKTILYLIFNRMNGFVVLNSGTVSQWSK